MNGGSLSPEALEEQRMADCKRIGRDPDTRSVSLLEQKRKVVSSSIDVPHARSVSVCVCKMKHEAVIAPSAPPTPP